MTRFFLVLAIATVLSLGAAPSQAHSRYNNYYNSYRYGCPNNGSSYGSGHYSSPYGNQRYGYSPYGYNSYNNGYYEYYPLYQQRYYYDPRYSHPGPHVYDRHHFLWFHYYRHHH